MARDKKTRDAGVVASRGRNPEEKTTDKSNGERASEPGGDDVKSVAAAPPEPKPEAKPEAKPEPEPKPGPGPSLELKPEPKAEPEAKPEPEAKQAPEAEAKPEPAPKAEAAKAAPASSSKPAPRLVADDDEPPAPNLVSIPAETRPGEREVLLRPDQIDTSVAPTAAAPAPGRAPRGDARSLRRAEEFCLIYRHKQFLIRRQGAIGSLGNWSITEYPSPAVAAHAYAQECSELSDSGFVDHRS